MSSAATLDTDLTVSQNTGGLLSVRAPGGSTATLTLSGNLVTDMTQEDAASGDVIRYLYSNMGSSQIGVTLQRLKAGVWENVQETTYTYYNSGSTKGSLGDLESVTLKEWTPGTPGSWTVVSRNYYRYWTGAGPNNKLHMLKFVVGPEGCFKIDPFGASDAELAAVADYYFEYDSNNRCTKEWINGATKKYTYSYYDNPNYTGQTDFNFWRRRTIETLPDNSTNIVYTNGYGLIMLKVFVSSGGQWRTFTTENRDYIGAEWSPGVGYRVVLKGMICPHGFTPPHRLPSETKT